MKYALETLINESRCYILPTRPAAPFGHIELLNKTYEAWYSCWSQVADSLEFEFQRDDFYRQDAILSLVGPQDEIMGCHLYSFFNLENDCSTQFSFFNRFDDKYLQSLRSDKLINSYSVEYLTVCPEFRGNRELSLARSIIGLSCELLKASYFDGILAQTRDDVNVNKMATEFGGKVISNGFKMNGIDSSFVSFHRNKLKLSPRQTVSEFVSNVWSKRLDLSNMTVKSKVKNRGKQARGVA